MSRIDFTPAGLDHLKALGEKLPSPRAGGLEHRYWQDKLVDHYEQRGYEVHREKTVGDHSVDLVATKGKEVIAIEVETGKSNFEENIRACLANRKLTSVTIACVTDEVARRVRERSQRFDDRRLTIEGVRRLLSG